MPLNYGDRLQALDFRRDFIKIQARPLHPLRLHSDSGASVTSVTPSLLRSIPVPSLEGYLDQLRTAVPAEKARSKRSKDAGDVAKALEAARHAKIMQEELAEALKAGEQSV